MTVPGATFKLELQDMLGQEKASELAVAYDLGVLAQDLMNENMNMMKRRARVRAKKVVEGWIAGVRSH